MIERVRPEDQIENAFRTYKAVGTVRFGSLTFTNVPVEIQQTPLGRTHFRCSIPSFDMNAPDLMSGGPIRIEGTTKNGLGFNAQSAEGRNVRPSPSGMFLFFDVRSLSRQPPKHEPRTRGFRSIFPFLVSLESECIFRGRTLGATESATEKIGTF